MRNQVAIRWARKPWLAVLLLAALGSRLLIPTGFMPGPGGIVLCTGHGPMIVHLPADMAGMDTSATDMPGMGGSQHAGTAGHVPHAPDHESSEVCPFAAAASTLATPVVPSFSVPGPFISTDLALPPQPFIPRGTIVPTRLPRGPPAHA